MSYPDLKAIFEAFENLRVLVVGDVMIDAYIYGSVERISPEAPVPVVSISKRDNRLGGAANVALNLLSLGAEPVLCAVTGDDAEAGTFRGLLEKRGLRTDGIITCSGRPTTIKNRIIAGSQQMLRIDSETDKLLDTTEEKALIARIKELVKTADLVIFEDYDKGCISKKLISDVVKFCNRENIPTAVDPKKRNFLHYKGVTLFKPNLKELKEGLKVEFEKQDKEGLLNAVRQLAEKLDFRNALITLSEQGVLVTDRSGDYVLVPAHIRNIADVSGAGDTVIAIAGLCLALGLSNHFLAELSNLGGGIVCESLGVVPIDRERLLQEAEKNNIIELV